MKAGELADHTHVIGDHNSDVVRLLEVAARQDRLSGLANVLQALASALDSDACIFWEQAPTGRLFVLAAALPEGWTPAVHYLGEESVTAGAIASGKTTCVPDVTRDDALRNASDKAFLKQNGVRTFATTPIHLSTGASGAISVYRTAERAYVESELERLNELASVIPNLYTGLIDRVGFQLLSKVRLDAFPTKSDAILQPLIEDVAATFNCLEASIFLEDWLDEPGVYRLAARVWEWPGSMPAIGCPLPGEGAARYAIEHRKTVRILDLADQTEVARQYPGLEWKDSWNIRKQIQASLQRGSGGELQPLTFVSVPIRGGERLSGVIRCCGARTAPFYFDARSVQFLSLIAERIGAWWETFLRRRQDSGEVDLWRRFADKVADMNSFVIDELARISPDESRIFRRALELVQDVFVDASGFAIRLRDAARNELYFAEVFGDLWDRYRSKPDDPRYKRYSLSGDPNSSGAWVWKNRDVRVVEDPTEDELNVVIFGETTREIAAPILAGDGFYGVLDIISTSKRRFGPIGKPVAKLLGRQIGLYHHLALKIHEIRQLERDSAERVEKERKTYENFEHQLRTPVMKAKRRATELVRDYSARRQLDPRLAILQSLCNQADRVTRNLRFFVQLAEERPIALPADSLETLTAPRLVGYLKEAAVDQSRQVPSRRRLEFTVDEKFIDDLHRVTVQANWDLLEQAIGNLLDNAGKYSYVGTRVRLSGGLTHKGESFYISVANQGYPLREPKRLAVRGYRGDEAQGSEGSGIGLWIVKNIMLAHKGSLEIIPTTSQGVNDFRLVFPKLKTGAA